MLSLLLLSTILCSIWLLFAANLLLYYSSNSRRVGKYFERLLQTPKTATQHLLFLQFPYWKAGGYLFICASLLASPSNDCNFLFFQQLATWWPDLPKKKQVPKKCFYLDPEVLA